MTLGPVQILVVGFDEPRFEGKIREELQRLRENDVVRLIDLLAVYKHDDGTVERLRASDLTAEEAAELGPVAAALVGLETDGEPGSTEVPNDLDDSNVWYVDDAIPPGSAAAVAVLEHRWAIELRDAIRDAGGFHLADAWVHPADLVAAGVSEAGTAALR
jgi:hypothetical protein